ncbi:hypothetical protein [uncultured Sphingopyxis sp.]|uniref:hypothetical protein n=1 Tax=uncultured Sphingopyxis sp. TaxID=310581 RepID=UPI002593F5F8|nr:hypothetical protein [uncultured Sphingopyxis sp.]
MADFHCASPLPAARGAAAPEAAAAARKAASAAEATPAEASAAAPVVIGQTARNGLAGLSMGMSGDYEEAVGFGATSVRVGSAIFGARDA